MIYNVNITFMYSQLRFVHHRFMRYSGLCVTFMMHDGKMTYFLLHYHRMVHHRLVRYALLLPINLDTFVCNIPPVDALHSKMFLSAVQSAQKVMRSENSF